MTDSVLESKKEKYHRQGKWLIIAGVILVLIAQIDFANPLVRMCPANGCPPLTDPQIFEFWWLGFILTFLGISLIASGIAFILKANSIGKTLVRGYHQQNSIGA